MTDIKLILAISLMSIGYITYQHTQERNKYEELITLIQEANKRKVQIEIDTSRVNAANNELQQTIRLLNDGLHSLPEIARVEYSNTLGELLTECSKRYSDLARKADEHTNDLRIYRGLKK